MKPGTARFEVRLSEPCKRQLIELAATVGLSSSDLVRMGIYWMLGNRDALIEMEGCPSSDTEA
jgi:hypothetical protein